jgi:RNA polymerase sigma-70 factor, ECF subfamily
LVSFIAVEAILSQPIESQELSVRSEAAFIRLWETERPRLWRLAARVAGSVDAADDLTQEVGLRAAQAFVNLRRLESGPAWLTKLTIHTALRWRERRREVQFLSASLPTPERGPEAQALQHEAMLRVQSAIDALPETLRTPLILHYWEGMSCRELAQTLELPLGTLLSRLFAARKRLRKELSDELFEP